MSKNPTEASTDYRHLFDLAKAQVARSYSPYSHFPVGAAVLMKSGKIFVGTNVENANFTNSICAERSAFVSAISAGERDFAVVAIASKSEIDTWPCGQCRQFMAEFGEDIVIVLESVHGGIVSLTTKDLLPERIAPKG